MTSATITDAIRHSSVPGLVHQDLYISKVIQIPPNKETCIIPQ